jgi:hypothetical protein
MIAPDSIVSLCHHHYERERSLILTGAKSGVRFFESQEMKERQTDTEAFNNSREPSGLPKILGEAGAHKGERTIRLASQDRVIPNIPNEFGEIEKAVLTG